MGVQLLTRHPRRVAAVLAIAITPFDLVHASDAGDTNAVANQVAQSPPVLETVIVTARLRDEDALHVPVSLSVVDSKALDTTVTNNISQITQLVPSLNYSSPNPRNTAFTIRGLGSSVMAVSQSNDGLEPGVGFYVDQIYHARPASAAFDFLDVDRVEILRGPQGTVFGKNTTAGAIHISTQAPSFDTKARAELSGADFGYLQAKASLNGSVSGDVLAGRLSIAVTRRDGVLSSVTTGAKYNNLNNKAIRGQLLFVPEDNVRLRLSADYTSINSTCCTQVYVRVGTSLKPAARQFPAMAAARNYVPPSLNPFDRKTDIDADLKVDTNEGGVSATADWTLGSHKFTSISAWRYWNWDAANDRDYTALSIQTVQHIPSRQDQYSQELRVASEGIRAVDYVAGLYWFKQTITGRPITQYGPVAAFWLLGPPPAIPANLLDGYLTDGHTRFTSTSYAAFGEWTWHATDRLNVSTGLRYTREAKDGTFASTVSGGLTTADPTLIARKLSILRPQSYAASVSDGSLSGRINASFQLSNNDMIYANYARGNKSGGINMSGLPLNAANLPALATAVVKPEKNTTVEIGLKSQRLNNRLTFNIDAYDTTVRDFQTNVVDSGPGALRGYLANIDKVRVRGAEFDGAWVMGEHWSAHASAAWSDGVYSSYKNGPCPLELIAATTTVCDLSGLPLSGLPHWVGSIGGEYVRASRLSRFAGQAFVHAEVSSRSQFFGDPSDSKFTLIDGYTVANLSVGFRSKSWEVSAWAKNLFNTRYIQNLTIQAGNSGLIVGTPSDPGMIGLSIKTTL